MKARLIAAAILTLISTALAEWNIEKPRKDVPEELTGEIFGRKFELGKATWNDAALSIESKDKLEAWPESELIIFAGTDEDQDEWLITPESENMEVDIPHIHMKFAKKGAKFPGTLMYTGEYSMYLKLLKKDDKKATFQIHVSLPDYKKSYLIGTFEAEIK